MKAAYRETDKPGYGKLVFSEDMLPDGPWQISIQRASDRKFLTGKGANPWVSETYYLELEGRPEADGSLAIPVGPNLVDRLDQQENYRINLRGENGEPLKARLHIAGISYSPGGSLDNTADVHDQPSGEESVQPEPAPTVSAEPIAPPAPQMPEPGSTVSDSDAASPEKTVEPQEEKPERLDLDAPAEANAQESKVWRWVILALLILGCLAWYFIDPRFEKQSDEEAPAPQASIASQVQEFFKNPDRSPSAALTLAEQMKPDIPEEQDAVYRLYYFAAENGDANALLAYGECLDPSLPPWGTIIKDAIAAFRAYQKSPQKEEAEKAMDRLHAWLEDQAKSGNEQAKEWLEQIN